jgi:fatty acid desaturase
LGCADQMSCGASHRRLGVAADDGPPGCLDVAPSASSRSRVELRIPNSVCQARERVKINLHRGHPSPALTEQKHPTRSKIFLEARIQAAVLAGVVAWCIAIGSLLPAFVVGLPTFFGAWLDIILFGFTQHAGLAEDVVDHRLNCRTVYMNPVFRFIYWNMNYHLEHHMFPMVPYHALPKLHEAMKGDTPPAYQDVIAAWTEILPALWRQRRDPTYFVERHLPATARSYAELTGAAA